MFRPFFLFFIVAFFPLISETKQTICLNMIVKDEEDVIERCLDSVKPLIDYWVIVDTGSTDGTQEVIRKHMKDIPGKLYEREWKGFAHNRSEALELAQDKGDYLLFVDADDWIAFEEGFQFPTLDKDLYTMRRGTDSFSFRFPQLVKSGLPWKYVGVIHEYLTCDMSYSSGELHRIKYVRGNGGARDKDPEKKFLTHIELLKEDLKKHPGNARSVFYLAESYRDAQKPMQALLNYEKRINMGGWDQETFWAMLQAAQLQKQLDFPTEKVIESYYRALCFRPHRAEPIYYLAEIFSEQKNYAMAYAMLKARGFIPQPPQKDTHFQLNWIENYGLLCQLSISSYYLGHYRESLDICLSLLQREDLSEGWKISLQGTLLYNLDKLGDQLVDRDISLEAALSSCKEIALKGVDNHNVFLALLQIARIEEKLDAQPEKVIACYQEAYRHSPSLVEPLYHLIRYYTQMGRHEDAYQTALEVLNTSDLEKTWFSSYGIPLEHSLAAWRLGKFQEAIRITESLLKLPNLSSKTRKQLEKNIFYYRAGLIIFDFAHQKWGTAPWETR